MPGFIFKLVSNGKLPLLFLFEGITLFASSLLKILLYLLNSFGANMASFSRLLTYSEFVPVNNSNVRWFETVLFDSSRSLENGVIL